MKQKNKVLITGITGFVGSNLRKFLNDEYEIKGVSRKKEEKLITYEDLNNEILSSSKALIHLAGKAHDLKKTSDEQEYFKVNYELTKEVFDSFLRSDSEVFIYMSSVKAIADEVLGVLNETIEPNPITAYGRSKLAAEEYILSKNINAGKRVYILRPCMIHGPNNKGNLNLLYNFVIKGIPYPFGKYENQRSFLSVKNLCFVINELIENQIESGVYNVADDTPLSTKELVKIISEAISRNANIWNVPKLFIKLIAIIGDVLPLPVNSERVKKLTENYVVSNKKIKEQINKKFPISSKEGIRITIKSFTNK